MDRYEAIECAADLAPDLRKENDRAPAATGNAADVQTNSEEGTEL